MKVALVHDWLLAPGGAEHVLTALHRIWPDAPIYTLLADPKRLPEELRDADIRTSYLDRFSAARRHHTKLLPLMPSAIESLRLGEVDLIVSSSHCVAKGVLVQPHQTHVCYCHTPMRYAWDLQEEYLEAAGLDRGLRGVLARTALSRIRTWDVASAVRVDRFLANSHYIAGRIERAYGRDATVVPPPVDVEAFQPTRERSGRMVTVSRLVRYKRVDLIVEAANTLGWPLSVYGSGPEEERLRKLAGPTVEILGWRPNDEVRAAVAAGRAFVTAAREDFGISTAEALAAGTPVIGLAGGGTADIVDDGKTGLLFSPQTVEGLVAALRRFETLERTLDRGKLRRGVMRFAPDRFRQSILREVELARQERGRHRKTG